MKKKKMAWVFVALVAITVLMAGPVMAKQFLVGGKPLNLFGYMTQSIAFSQHSAHRRWRVKRRNAGTRHTNPFSQCALRNEFELNPARLVQLREHFGLAGTGKGTDHLAHLTVTNQGGQPHFTVPGIVIDNGKAGWAVVDQCMNQLDRAARCAEATHHHGRSVRNISNGFRDGWKLLVNHLVLLLDKE